MKQTCGLLIPVLLILAGCKPHGHGVTQALFHKDIYLNIPATDFKETNRRSIRVLPHTWIKVKRVNAILTDGTVIPCRDFRPTAIEMVHDESLAILIGTLDLPVPDVAEVSVVVDRNGQCSGADDGSLSPCALVDEQSTATTALPDAPSGEITLRYTLPNRDRNTGKLVLRLNTLRDKQLPNKPLSVTLTTTGQLPPDVDDIETQWMPIVPNSDGTKSGLPYDLITQHPLQPQIALKGRVNPDTRVFTPDLQIDWVAPERITIGGTVVRLDIDKKTFQLRVSDTTDGQPYGTLYLRAGDLTSYAFSGGQSPATVPATFDDIGIGRKIWISVLNHFDPDDRLEALDIRILDRNAPQR